MGLSPTFFVLGHGSVHNNTNSCLLHLHPNESLFDSLPPTFEIPKKSSAWTFFFKFEHWKVSLFLSLRVIHPFPCRPHDTVDSS